MNIKLSLGGIQDILRSSLEVRDFVHNSKSDGSGVNVISTMAFIPKFITSGWPQAALNGLSVGGFWVDVHKCCQWDASSVALGSVSADAPTTFAACSRQGVVPWTGISWISARIAASNRVIQGRNCHLITPFERFAILSWVMQSGNWGNIRGNNNNGKDTRDAATWDKYGIFDPVLASPTRTLTGSGPPSWWSNGIIGAGLADLVGNIWEWEDCRLESGLYQPKAFLNGARIATDAYIIYDDNAGGDGANICHLSPGVYTITDAVNGDEDVTVIRVHPTGRFAGRAVLSAGLTLPHGDNCLIQLKTALDVTSTTKTGLAAGVGGYKAMGKLLEDATGKHMALPDFADTTTHAATLLDSGYAYHNGDSRALRRCGYWETGTGARAGLTVYCYNTPATVYTSLGFRAALAVGTL